MFFHSFQTVRPKYESSQESSLKWLLKAYSKAKQGIKTEEELARSLQKVACGSNYISSRSHVTPDFLHEDWKEMEIYQLEESLQGRPLSQRAKIFSRETEKVFDQLYSQVATPPDDLLHVTCTGYGSPSAAQKMVSKKGWEKETTVTHVYHMGCYGCIPALRIAKGLLLSSEEKTSADIVHTEICTIHCNPSDDRPGQMVSQTIFGDGFIKYTVSKKPKGPSFLIRSLREETIPNSSDAMKWDMSEYGFEMFLSKEIPVFISQHLEGYLKRLVGSESTLFAVHPGGPKILRFIQKILRLEEGQLSHSYKVFKEFGNMSSATLPYILKGILEDPSIPEHVPIVLLAFGPGLTIAGGVVEKV